MSHEIEKGVPVPSRWINEKYPLDDMEVGDSFFTNSPAVKVRPAVTHYGRRNGRKYVTRSMDGGLRVWRVE